MESNIYKVELPYFADGAWVVKEYRCESIEEAKKLIDSRVAEVQGSGTIDKDPFHVKKKRV